MLERRVFKGALQTSFVTDEPAYFSKLLIESQEPGTLFEWCKINRGAFIVTRYLNYVAETDPSHCPRRHQLLQLL